jgi:hypothetical protein
MTGSDDGWTVVGKDGKFSGPGTHSANANGAAVATCCDAEGATSTVEGCLQHVTKLLKELEGSNFYGSLRTATDKSGTASLYQT